MKPVYDKLMPCAGQNAVHAGDLSLPKTSSIGICGCGPGLVVEIYRCALLPRQKKLDGDASRAHKEVQSLDISCFE